VIVTVKERLHRCNVDSDGEGERESAGGRERGLALRSRVRRKRMRKVNREEGKVGMGRVGGDVGSLGFLFLFFIL
jgi:hypothetical protein